MAWVQSARVRVLLLAEFSLVFARALACDCLVVKVAGTGASVQAWIIQTKVYGELALSSRSVGFTEAGCCISYALTAISTGIARLLAEIHYSSTSGTAPPPVAVALCHQPTASGGTVATPITRHAHTRIFVDLSLAERSCVPVRTRADEPVASAVVALSTVLTVDVIT